MAPMISIMGPVLAETLTSLLALSSTALMASSKRPCMWGSRLKDLMSLMPRMPSWRAEMTWERTRYSERAIFFTLATIRARPKEMGDMTKKAMQESFQSSTNIVVRSAMAVRTSCTRVISRCMTSLVELAARDTRVTRSLDGKCTKKSRDCLRMWRLMRVCWRAMRLLPMRARMTVEP